MPLTLRFLGFILLMFSSFTSIAQFQRDGISISVGGNYTQVDSTISTTLVGKETSYKGTLDFESDLLVEDSSAQPLFDLNWAFKERHQLSVNYFALNRNGSKLSGANIDIGDYEFQAGALLNTQFDLSLWQFKYAYSIYQTETMAAGVSGGLHMINFDLGFTGVVAVDSSTEGTVIAPVEKTLKLNNTIPLPNIGIYYHYLLTENFYLNLDAQYFAINLDIPDSSTTLDAGLLSLDAGAEYYPWEQFSLYLGVSYYDVYANIVTGTNYDADIEWDVNLSYWGPKIAVKYTF